MPVKPSTPDARFLRLGGRVLEAIANYHDHRVYGLEHLPRKGRAMVVVNHSFATYDIGLLVLAIYKHTGRLIRGLGDRALFRTPIIATISRKSGVMVGSPEHAQTLFAHDKLVLVAPGGMMEALRTSEERYQIRWQNRKGFIREAILAQAPVILAACPQADDLYQIYNTPFTNWIYEKHRMPFTLLRGVGPTLIPRKVPLTHRLSEPLIPPTVPADDVDLRAAVDEFHEMVCRRMESLMLEALNSTTNPDD
ncbi:MAG: hypothetical protein CMH54_14850 [Myxococcales bacterium]|nr:hypothetical protein [Myxococcales bacterium]